MTSAIRISIRGAVLVGAWIFCGGGPVRAQPVADETQIIPAPGQVPPLPPRLPEGIPAFPGAWGGGMFATGGRGGKVVEVTTRSDNGPGSLRAAIREQGPRIVVFRVAGNIVEGFPEVTANNWAGTRGPEEIARVNTPFEGWPVNQQPALEAFQAVLAKGGATLPRRDAVDARVIEMVRTGKVSSGNGIINDPKEVGGYPDYSFSPHDVPVDADHDGMSDGAVLGIATGFDKRTSGIGNR